MSLPAYSFWVSIFQLSNIPSVIKQPMKEKEESEDYEIAKSWTLHSESDTLVFCISRKLAQRYNLKKPCRLLLIPKDDGILLKKMELKIS